MGGQTRARIRTWGDKRDGETIQLEIMAPGGYYLLFLPASLFLLKHVVFMSIIINPLGTNFGKRSKKL